MGTRVKWSGESCPGETLIRPNAVHLMQIRTQRLESSDWSSLFKGNNIVFSREFCLMLKGIP